MRGGSGRDLGDLHGVVVVDKADGMTSHDVVDRVRGSLGTRRVGHAGTLDPAATGVLIVGVGAATKFLSFAQGAPKRYLATAIFGIMTSTQDASGDVLERRPAKLTIDQLRRAARAFTGEIKQIPPMVSAVKIGGERLYAKARRGEEVFRAARPVTVYALDVLELGGDEETSASLAVHCSSGTYVRTLVHDLGLAVGSGAHLARLRRTEAGGFTEAEAVPLESVTRSSLRPLLEVVRVLPKIEIDDEAAVAVSHGRPLPVAAMPGGPPEDAAAALTSQGRLAAVYRRRGDVMVAERVVPNQLREPSL